MEARVALRVLVVVLVVSAASASLRSAVVAFRSKILPDRTADVDGQNVNIKDIQVYTLPQGSAIYHGTVKTGIIDTGFSPYTNAARVKMDTWFGADLETSAAMGYWQYCRTFNEKKKDHGLTSNPLLLTVNTQKELNLLFVPCCYPGHINAAQVIGIDNLPTDLKSLYGSGSSGRGVADLLKQICQTEVSLNGKKIALYKREGKICKPGEALSKCKSQSDEGTKWVKLNGWRAPWDQNEIAICHEDTTTDRFVIDKSKIIKLPVIMKKSGEKVEVDVEKTCDPSRAFLFYATGGFVGSKLGEDAEAVFDISWVHDTAWTALKADIDNQLAGKKDLTLDKDGSFDEKALAERNKKITTTPKPVKVGTTKTSQSQKTAQVIQSPKQGKTPVFPVMVANEKKFNGALPAKWPSNCDSCKEGEQYCCCPGDCKFVGKFSCQPKNIDPQHITVCIWKEK